MENEEVYQRFVEWLRSCGACAPHSKELMPLLEATYRPEDARLLTGASHRH